MGRARFELANLFILGLLVAGAIIGAIGAGLPWWAVALVGVGTFFGGGWVVERYAPGTRLLFWLGWNGRIQDPTATDAVHKTGPRSRV